MRWKRRGREERSAPFITEETHFSAGDARDLTAIVTAAAALPRPATVFLEGTSMSTDTRTFLADRAGAPGRNDLSGTIWPRSRQFHLPLSDDVIDGLCALTRAPGGARGL